MDDSFYLVAISLANQESLRIMPIGGKSINSSKQGQDFPKEDAQIIFLELLTRLLERSIESPICLANEGKSMLLIQIAMVPMQERLPQLKSNWIKTGDTLLFISELEKICTRLWSLSFKRYEGIKFNLIFEHKE